MLKMLPKMIKRATKLKLKMRTKKDKNVRIEKYYNLRKNKGFGEVLHVKNVAEKEEIGTKKKNWCQKQRTRCERKRQKRSH